MARMQVAVVLCLISCVQTSDTKKAQGVIEVRQDSSCQDRCDGPLDQNKPCQCNSHCVGYEDCCDDYHAVCLGSCQGKCNDPYDGSKPCQCNSACVNFDNCCNDYQQLCTGPSLDLDTFVNFLWDNDANRMLEGNYQVNYQGETTPSDRGDHANEKFFTTLNEQVFQHSITYQTFVALLDNFVPVIGEPEQVSLQEQRELDNFLDAVMATDVMTETYNFLHSSGYFSGNLEEFANKLRELWLNLYGRSSTNPVLDSSGFEHVMVGESRPTYVSGFHSWIQFYYEEKSGRLDYKGYVRNVNPGVANLTQINGAHFTWNGLWKDFGSFFVGTSPEFDMAIYTICIVVHPNSHCSFNIKGTQITIQTWYHNNDKSVGSAYPVI